MGLHVKLSNVGKSAIKMKKGHIRVKLSTRDIHLAFAYIFPPIKRKKETKKVLFAVRSYYPDNFLQEI